MQFSLFHHIIINLKISTVLMFYTGSARTFTSYTISGCSVKLRWNLTNASQYDIYITSQNNSSFYVQIQTSEHTFVFVAERQGVNYTLKWTLLYYNSKGTERYRSNTSKDHTVYIAKGTVESCKAEFALLICQFCLTDEYVNSYLRL